MNLEITSTVLQEINIADQSFRRFCKKRSKFGSLQSDRLLIAFVVFSQIIIYFKNLKIKHISFCKAKVVLNDFFLSIKLFHNEHNVMTKYIISYMFVS